jgi:hypothetical protein
MHITSKLITTSAVEQLPNQSDVTIAANPRRQPLSPGAQSQNLVQQPGVASAPSPSSERSAPRGRSDVSAAASAAAFSFAFAARAAAVSFEAAAPTLGSATGGPAAATRAASSAAASSISVLRINSSKITARKRLTTKNPPRIAVTRRSARVL